MFVEDNCPICYEKDCQRVNFFCFCTTTKHCESCTIRIYKSSYPYASDESLRMVVVDKLPSYPIYNNYTHLEKMVVISNPHVMDETHFCSFRSRNYYYTDITDETSNQMIDNFSLDKIKTMIYILKDISRTLFSYTKRARIYSPDEPRFYVPIWEAVGYGRRCHEVIEQASNHINVLRALSYLSE